MRRVSYHQSVFDLLDMQPQESPQAREMIEACEARSGQRLPESVRQWYLIDGVVFLRPDNDWRERVRNQRDYLWYDYSNMDLPESLEAVLRQFESGRTEGHEQDERRPPAGSVRVMVENQGVCSWYIQPDGSDDPPVIVDAEYDHQTEQVIHWVRVADRFSAFIFDWFADYYYEDWTPLSERNPYPDRRTRPPRENLYRNGLWLYAPHAEAVAPPSLDYLMENLTEDAHRPIADDVMQYHFRKDNGRLRVTTDRYGEGGGASAWWLHAGSEEGLYRLAERVLLCGGLSQTLRHRTDAARPVMDRLRQRFPGVLEINQGK
jgi:hypothetical protein